MKDDGVRQLPEASAFVVGLQLLVFSSSEVFFGRKSVCIICTHLHDEVNRDLECVARSDGVDFPGWWRVGLFKKACACKGDVHKKDSRRKITLFMPVVDRTGHPRRFRGTTGWSGGICGDPGLSFALSSSPSIASLQTRRKKLRRMDTCLHVPAAVLYRRFSKSGVCLLWRTRVHLLAVDLSSL